MRLSHVPVATSAGNSWMIAAGSPLSGAPWSAATKLQEWTRASVCAFSAVCARSLASSRSLTCLLRSLPSWAVMPSSTTRLASPSIAFSGHPTTISTSLAIGGRL